MNYGRKFVTLYRKWEEDHSQEKEMQKSKMAVARGGLASSYENKRSEKQRRKGKI